MLNVGKGRCLAAWLRGGADSLAPNLGSTPYQLFDFFVPQFLICKMRIRIMSI